MSFVDGTRIADIPQRRRIVLITFSSLLIVINYEKNITRLQCRDFNFD